MGQGLGSWIINFPLYQVSSSTLELRWENAHNDTVQLIFELGVGGAILVAIFLFRLATSERRPEFYALLVFFVESCFEFPLYQPVTGALAMVCAGWLFSRGDSLRHALARLRLSIRPGDANARGSLHIPGGGTVPARSGPTFGPGLSCYSDTRRGPFERYRPGTQV